MFQGKSCSHFGSFTSSHRDGEGQSVLHGAIGLVCHQGGRTGGAALGLAFTPRRRRLADSDDDARTLLNSEHSVPKPKAPDCCDQVSILSSCLQWPSRCICPTLPHSPFMSRSYPPSRDIPSNFSRMGCGSISSRQNCKVHLVLRASSSSTRDSRGFAT